MPEIYLAKRFDGLLEAADDDTIEALHNVAPNSLLYCSFKTARNPGNHRRWFKFVQVSFDMQDHFENKAVWRKHIQMLAGWYDAVVLPNGDTQYWPRSISFKDLDDEVTFRKLFDKAVSAFLGRYGKDMTESDFLRALDFS
jgi:hypothetical protein